MRKLITTLILIIAAHAVVWAQGMMTNAKAEECIDLMNTLMSAGNSNALTYDFNGTKITKTEKAGAAKFMEQILHIDWASYRGLSTKERKDTLTVVLSFNNPPIKYDEVSVMGYLYTRDIYRTNTIEFDIPSSRSNRLEGFGNAANRLAQIAKSGGNPLLKVTIPARQLSAIPTQEEIIRNLERFQENISPMKMGITRAEDDFLLIIEEHAEGKRLAAAALPLSMLKSVKYDGKKFSFDGYIEIQADPSAESDVVPSIEMDLLTESSSDRSWMLPFLKLHLWRFGADLEDGFEFSIEGAALPSPPM